MDSGKRTEVTDHAPPVIGAKDCIEVYAKADLRPQHQRTTKDKLHPDAVGPSAEAPLRRERANSNPRRLRNFGESRNPSDEDLLIGRRGWQADWGGTGIKKTDEIKATLHRLSHISDEAQRSPGEGRPKFYYLKDATRYAHRYDPDDTNWLAITRFLLACFADGGNLPVDLVTLFANYFLVHLGLLREEPELLAALPPKSALVFTYSPAVIQSLKKFFWILSDLYFPNQSSGGGLAEYDTTEELLAAWSKFHLVSLAHLDEEAYSAVLGAVSRQNNQLFTKRWPLILVADPSQEDWGDTRGVYSYHA